jgi:hypothetical protein
MSISVLIRTPSIAAKSRIGVPARSTNSCRTSGSRRTPPHDASPPRELAARGARFQASDLGTNGDRPTTSRAWPCKLAPRLPPWSRAARTSPPASLEPSAIRNIYDWYYATQSPVPKRPPLPPRPSRENENLAKYSHKTPTRDELVVARVIRLANPGSFR